MKKHQRENKIALSYLNLQTPQENRGNILVFFIVTLDLIGLLPLLAYPYAWEYFIAAIIPVAIIHLWAILYIIDPYRFENSYYLFFGIYGFINTYVYFLATQKLMYAHLNINSPIPLIVGAILYGGLLIIFNFLNVKALYSGFYAKMQQNGTSVNVSPILAACGMGYFLAQLIMSVVYSDSFTVILLVSLISLLSIVTAFFSTFVHKYFYIKRNFDLVKKVYPDFGLPKNQRKTFQKKKKK
ncbi:hypothetical protein FZC76_04425 [Sutcliffiella horikoshii]|uniref:Uncharacterized protein n=1 Tax=Sutcliffiella horikoshii TaxID=79883 RepID=A0A5D4T4A6_9BACI|nr:hypothetical protein [Sutcliffiella horikoshii]TYS69488.1 hypothetical protein FZC76_04425 [Sutcliffiella horikoshii]